MVDDFDVRDYECPGELSFPSVPQTGGQGDCDGGGEERAGSSGGSLLCPGGEEVEDPSWSILYSPVQEYMAGFSEQCDEGIDVPFDDEEAAWGELQSQARNQPMGGTQSRMAVENNEADVILQDVAILEDF